MTEFSNDIVNLRQALEEAERMNHKKNDFLKKMKGFQPRYTRIWIK